MPEKQNLRRNRLVAELTDTASTVSKKKLWGDPPPDAFLQHEVRPANLKRKVQKKSSVPCPCPCPCQYVCMKYENKDWIEIHLVSLRPWQDWQCLWLELIAGWSSSGVTPLRAQALLLIGKSGYLLPVALNDANSETLNPCSLTLHLPLFPKAFSSVFLGWQSISQP